LKYPFDRTALAYSVMASRSSTSISSIKNRSFASLTCCLRLNEFVTEIGKNLRQLYTTDRRISTTRPVLDVVVIDTTRPWGIEATTGETRFEVHSDQLTGLCREE
jgi:hypothetical protein